MMQFTEEQMQVITSRGENLLVSAAAGSGKTAVLVERIIRRVLDQEHPVDIDRMLIVTFTNAAAAEMRERISLAIGKALEEQPENEHLQRQSTLVHNAQIMTIDSFCLFILRNNFNDIGLDPAFRVADEGEVRLLEEDVMGRLLEEQFAEGTEEFFLCVETFSINGREQNLEQDILELYHYALSHPFPEQWLEARKQDYDINSAEQLSNSPFVRQACDYAGKSIAACKEQIEQALALCNRPDGPYMYGPALESDLELLDQLVRVTGYEEYCEWLAQLKFVTLSAKRDPSVNAQIRQDAKDLRDQVKANLQELKDKFFSASPESIVEQCALCKPAVEELIVLALKFKQRMDERKREKEILDFSDMEHLALQILLTEEQDEEGNKRYVPSKTARDYQDYYEEIMTDEYQDSNMVQEYLLNSIARQNNCFMVGDVKQSIYMFRMARPKLFLDKQKDYREKKVPDSRVIDLHKNFRSRNQVLRGVNYVFKRIMTSTVGGIEYDDSEALYPGAQYPEPAGGADDYTAELLLVPKSGELPEEELDDKQKEAAVIARRIRELVGHFPVTDRETGELRPAGYRDIVILLRSSSGYDEALRTILEEEGIPAYITSKTGYFLTTEIRVLIQVLRVWDNPLQDIPLYGVLTSVFAGFSEEEMAVIRGETTEAQRRRKVPLYHSLQRYAQAGGDGPLTKKVQDFLTWLSGWRARTVYLPIHELLQQLLTESHYVQYVAALPAGEKRRANVELLLEKAKAFEKTSFYGLFHFIRYLEKMEKYEIDYGEADTLDENADLVRIMTIHKSKGLEFPICFVAGLSKRFNMRDTSQMLLAELDLGIGTDAVDVNRRTYVKTLRKTVMASKMQLDALGEELRVLYVAMTRAKEKLIMTGLAGNGEKWVKQLRKARQAKLNFVTLSKAGCYLDYLLPALSGQPDFDGLCRDAALEQNCDPENCGQEVFFRIRRVGAEELTGKKLKEGISRVEARAQLHDIVNGKTELSAQEQECLAIMKNSFCYEYPHQNLANLYTKITVSELKKAAMQEEQDSSFHLFEEEMVPYVPAFMRKEESVSGTTRGSAFHKVMELLPLERLAGVPELSEKKLLCQAVEREMDALLAEGYLTSEYREAVNPWKIAGFLQSPLAVRMARADREGTLYREQPFVLGIPANRLGAEFPESEMVLVQGIIDVCFEEDGRMILVDYKTDVVDKPIQLVERYHAQLEYYAEALERLRKLPVEEKIIYSFHFEGEISCE